MLWEHEPQTSVSTASSSFPKLSLVFTISFRKHRDEKNENNLLTLTIKMEILFARAIITSTVRASSVFLSG